MSDLTTEELIDGLMVNVRDLAEKAASSQSINAAEKCATAALSLAEAIAWLVSPNQSHGGHGSVEVTSKG